MEEQDGVEEVNKASILFLIFLFSCTQSHKLSLITFDNNASFKVELALTDEAREQGLMHRTELPEHQGMLFVFGDESPRGFWMKDTLIPLDMVFLDKDMRVIEVKAQVPPCKSDPCPTYVSAPAQYVLEIMSGSAEKNGIKKGSLMTLSE